MATVSLPVLQAFIAEAGLKPLPSFTEADVLNNPVDIYHAYLAEHLQTLVECNAQLIYSSIQPSNTIENGDLDIVLPKLKIPGVSPKDLAGQLLKKYQPHPLFAAPFKDGVHIRFLYSTRNIPRLLLPYISDRGENYGALTSSGSQTGHSQIVVEFSSPNIAREFTPAHLRSTILGACVANIYASMGYTVVRINHLGDWGKNLGLLGAGWRKYGSVKSFDDQTELLKYIHELYSKMEEELQPEQEARKKARGAGQDTSIIEDQGLFAERDATFKQMEDGEPEAIALWKKLRDITVAYYVDTYARLNIKFDEHSGESKVCVNSKKVVEVESALKDKSICEERDGEWVIDFDKHGARLGSAALRDRNGLTTYLLRDIATVFDRLETHSFDKMVYVVCEQEVHFRQVFKAVELTGRADVAKKLQHIAFTKPTGHTAHPHKARLLGDILDVCENIMGDAMVVNPDDYQIPNRDAVAKEMGINSLILQELSSRKIYNSGLNLDLLTIAEGDTGTSLQLCFTRLCSAISQIGSPPSACELRSIDYSSLSEPPWSEVLRLLVRYPEVTHSAAKSLEPGTLLSYLFRVMEEITACLDEEDESEGQGSAVGSMYEARIALYEATRQVLSNGLKILGVVPKSSCL